MVDVAPARERWITPHALLGATSAGSASLTTAGLLAGPAGVATVSAAGVLVAGGVAAVRKFAPGAANKLGLKKADGKKADKKAKGDRSKGGLGRLGLLGAAGRKKAAAGAGSTKRGAGLLGTARKAAGKGAQLAGRAATAAGKKGAGLLGSKQDAAGKSNKARGTGSPGGKKPAGTAKSGTSKSGTGKTPTRKNPAGTRNSGTKGTRSGKDAGGRKGLGGRLLGGVGRLLGRGVKGLLTGPSGGTNEPDVPKQPKTPKGTKGPGLLGGDKDRTRKTKPDKTKTPKNNRPRGRDTRPAIPSGKPDRNRSRRGHGGSTMPNPFASRTEAISGAAPLEIERANDVIDYVTHAPDHAEAQARRWLNEADTIVEKIDLTPEFAESLKDYANAQLQQVQRVREYGEVFRRSHSDRLAKLQRKDPREAMWDIDRNRD